MIGPLLIFYLLSASVCMVSSHAIVSPENTKKRGSWHYILVERHKSLLTTGIRKLNSPSPEEWFSPCLFFLDFVNASCNYIACNRFTREHKKKRERWHHVRVWCFKAFELLGSENEIMFGLKNDWAPAYFHQFCWHQFAKCFLMQLFHQRTQRKERGGILFELGAPRTFERLGSGN